MLPFIDEHALEISEAVRFEVEKYAQENFDAGFCSETLCGACAFASIILADVLIHLEKFDSVEVVEIESSPGSHCVVEINDAFFIDITATQFGDNPRVVVSDDFESNGLMFETMIDDDDDDDDYSFIRFGKNQKAKAVTEKMLDKGWEFLDRETTEIIADLVIQDFSAKKVA